MCKELLLSADIPAVDNYSPRTNLQLTKITLHRYVLGLLLSADNVLQFLTNCFLVRFFRITFLWYTLFKFRFQIWNQHKILHFLIPVLTYLKNKSFLLWTVLLLATNNLRFCLLLSADTICRRTFTFACKSNGAGQGPLKGFYVNCELAL